MDTIRLHSDTVLSTTPIHCTRLPQRRLVVAMGAFDGVHLGHQALIRDVQSVAQQGGLLSGVVTFEPHPQLALHPERGLRLISDSREQEILLERTGLDYTIVLPFSREFAMLSSEQFLDRVLSRQLGIHTLVVGFDHHFGHDKDRTYTDYEATAARYGIRCLPSQPYALPGGQPISSTAIRRHIAMGEIVEANRLLGYRYLIVGRVQSGLQVGRKLGYPTANIVIADPHKALPTAGVYMALTSITGGESQVPSMFYIGTRPTLQLSQERLSVEIFLMGGGDYDLYGQELQVELCDRQRGEMKFDSLEALSHQISLDERAVRSYFSLD